MSYNYQVVLFKNKVKKKIINKFKTHKKANELFISLLRKVMSLFLIRNMKMGENHYMNWRC
jgi:hypothetical protein